MDAVRYVEFTSQGFLCSRADHWDLANPTWSGRVRVCTYGPKCVLKLEDKTTGTLVLSEDYFSRKTYCVVLL